ncbi:hypothetical protein KEM55_002897 [Ascosphaera atra]|nr:hypothetical protein KEM55_002897 [Ascosphaera atra]
MSASRRFSSLPSATAIPSMSLHESSPGEKVDLSTELGPGQHGIIIGVPAAYSPACSAAHVPGYMNHPKVKSGEAGKVFVVGVNDAFVMKAWGQGLHDKFPGTKVRFLADPSGAFTKTLHSSLLWSGGQAVFGNDRSKRYALLVKDGKIFRDFVEPDNTGLDVSMAENVLGEGKRSKL